MEEVDLGRSSDVSRRRFVCVRPWTISLISAALSVGGVAASDDRKETQRRGEHVPFEQLADESEITNKQTSISSIE